MPKKNILILALGVVLVLMFGFFLLRLTSTNSNNNKKEVTNSAAPSRVLPKEVTVTLTDKGFSPNNVEIAAGNAVRFLNESGDSKASVNSDDYPTNKKFPELNLGTFQKGSTLVHIFDKPGTYTYHDQFHPDFKGTVVVQ